MNRLILIGGGSSSGKSYITKAVMEKLGPDNIVRLTMDDYYKDQSDMPMEDRYKVNYDHPKAFDWPLMRKQLKDLKDGKTILKPVYDFVTLTRTDKVEEIVPKKVILVEGIMALVDKAIRSLGDLKVFITASAERRFLRRLIRDRRDRGREFDNIVSQYFSTVQPMYGEIVEPSSIYADFIINNDGVKNLAIDIMVSLVKEEISSTDQEKQPKAMEEEFDAKSLNEAFK